MKKDFESAGFKPEVRTLASFQDDYGLKPAEGEETGEDEDEDEEDEDGELEEGDESGDSEGDESEGKP